MKDVNALKKLTEGLFYPAGIATGFLSLAVQAEKQGPHLLVTVPFWLAVIFLFYFSISFLHTVGVEDARYGPGLFLLDLGEAVATIVMLDFLGFLDTSGAPHPELGRFYYALLVVLLIQTLWQGTTRIRKNVVIWQGVAAAGLAVFGCLLPEHILNSAIVSWAMVAVFAFLVVSYTISYANTDTSANSAKPGTVKTTEAIQH